MPEIQLSKNVSNEYDNGEKSFIKAELEEFIQFQIKDIEIRKEEIEIRKEEFEIRKKEIDLETQKDNHAFEFSKEALNKQSEDRIDDRNKKYGFFNTLTRYGIFSLSLILLFFGFAIYMDKEVIVVEILKIIGTAAISIFGGYHFGFSKGKKKNQDSDSNK